MSDDLGINFRGELVPFGYQPLLQLQVVFDDSIVNHDHRAVTIAVRMGVLLRGGAVGGPARVPHAVSSVHRVQADHFFEVVQFARGAAHLEVVALNHCNTRRVVAAVLQPLQSFQQNRHDAFVSDVTNNS